MRKQSQYNNLCVGLGRNAIQRKLEQRKCCPAINKRFLGKHYRIYVHITHNPCQEHVFYKHAIKGEGCMCEEKWCGPVMVTWERSHITHSTRQWEKFEQCETNGSGIPGEKKEIEADDSGRGTEREEPEVRKWRQALKQASTSTCTKITCNSDGSQSFLSHWVLKLIQYFCDRSW